MHTPPPIERQSFLAVFAAVYGSYPLLQPGAATPDDAEAFREDLDDALCEALATLGRADYREPVEGGSLDHVGELHDWIDEAYPHIDRYIGETSE